MNNSFEVGEISFAQKKGALHKRVSVIVTTILSTEKKHPIFHSLGSDSRLFPSSRAWRRQACESRGDRHHLHLSQAALTPSLDSGRCCQANGCICTRFTIRVCNCRGHSTAFQFLAIRPSVVRVVVVAIVATVAAARESHRRSSSATSRARAWRGCCSGCMWCVGRYPVDAHRGIVGIPRVSAATASSSSSSSHELLDEFVDENWPRTHRIVVGQILVNASRKVEHLPPRVLGDGATSARAAESAPRLQQAEPSSKCDGPCLARRLDVQRAVSRFPAHEERESVEVSVRRRVHGVRVHFRRESLERRECSPSAQACPAARHVEDV